jgi:hypothetical protein
MPNASAMQMTVNADARHVSSTLIVILKVSFITTRQICFTLSLCQSLQLLRQGNALSPSSIHINHHHNGERQADQDGQKPERLFSRLAHILIPDYMVQRTRLKLQRKLSPATQDGDEELTGLISPYASVMAPTIAGPNILLPLSVIAYKA